MTAVAKALFFQKSLRLFSSRLSDLVGHPGQWLTRYFIWGVKITRCHEQGAVQVQWKSRHPLLDLPVTL